MTGFLLLNKPSGITSHDVVNRARKALAERRIGHAGTLDPFAEGLLLLAVGSYTRLIPLFDDEPKEYIAEGIFGELRDTGDVDGVPIETFRNAVPCSFDALSTVIRERFTGALTQTPPKYSALKVNGERAYTLAREGKPFTLAKRTITVHAIDLLSYEYPRFTIRVTASRGTYIRTLVEDIARAVDNGAYTKTLTRTAIGNRTLDEAITLEEIDTTALKPFRAMFPFIERVRVETEADMKRIRSGDVRALTAYGEGRKAFVNHNEEVIALADCGAAARYRYVNPNA